MATGHEMKEAELCWMVIVGLPKECDALVTIVESSTEKLTFEAKIPQLLQLEQRQGMANNSVKVLRELTRDISVPDSTTLDNLVISRQTARSATRTEAQGR